MKSLSVFWRGMVWPQLNRYSVGITRGVSLEGFTCQCWRGRKHRFDPWVGKIPWRRKWQPTPIFFPRILDRGAWRVAVPGVRHDSATEHSHITANYQVTVWQTHLPCWKFHVWDFPGGTGNENPNEGDMGLIPGLAGFHVPQSNWAHTP